MTDGSKRTSDFASTANIDGQKTDSPGPPSMVVVTDKDADLVIEGLSDGIEFVHFSQLAGRLQRSPTPDIVLSPLIAESFDVTEVAKTLSSAEYPGRLRALTPDRPNISIIKREIHALYPQLDFAVLKVTPEGNLELT